MHASLLSRNLLTLKGDDKGHAIGGHDGDDVLDKRRRPRLAGKPPLIGFHIPQTHSEGIPILPREAVRIVVHERIINKDLPDAERYNSIDLGRQRPSGVEHCLYLLGTCIGSHLDYGHVFDANSTRIVVRRLISIGRS